MGKMLRANWIFWEISQPTEKVAEKVQVLKAIENEPAKPAINPPAGLRKHVLKQNAAAGEINVMYILPCSCQFLLSSASFPWGSQYYLEHHSQSQPAQ